MMRGAGEGNGEQRAAEGYCWEMTRLELWLEGVGLL